MTKKESDLIVENLNESRDVLLKAVAKVKADYHELCSLKDMQIAKLEKEISVLLSCKNCPEYKGGFICQKEYENKCLKQKIQFIKELQEEIAELEKEKCELLGIIQGKDNAIAELEEQLEITKSIIEKMKDIFFGVWQEKGYEAIKFEEKVNEILNRGKA